MLYSAPRQQGLYDPVREHDACGIGAVVNISGQKDHAILEHGRQILLNLQHRGAAGADESTGDGAGILFQVPHEFVAAQAREMGIELPPAGGYAVAQIFLPRQVDLQRICEKVLIDACGHYGFKVLGWRDVPADNSCLGQLARACEPAIRQAFIDAGQLRDRELERKLFMARKRCERLVRERLGEQGEDFYICSMSSKTIVYKGMFLAPQLFAYYGDLNDERMTSALAIVHQRYSTNTFPCWKLAHPFRMTAHNGEINTLSGNSNRMRAREMTLACPALGSDLSDVLPVLTPGGSDSACFDNALELLVQAGRSLPHAIMMMIPEAFGSSYHISTDKRAFYEYHAATMEPWDGPAAIVFTDGRVVGGTLDRNGLRPARYVVTTDGLLVLASEVGVIEFPPERIKTKGRLQPGKMFLVDTVEGRIVVDNEIKSKIARQRPYRRWLEENRIELRGLFAPSHVPPSDSQTIAKRLRAFGYTREELAMILAPMALHAQEPVGSMGTDTPLAVLTNRPTLLFNYFKQLFAQVTNPPIDPLREGLVMSLMTFCGKQRNLLDETPEHCRQLKLPHPILANDDIERLRRAQREDFRSATIDALFDVDPADPAGALRRGLDELIVQAERAIRDGASVLIVSDRALSRERAPIPSLLAVSALRHGLLDRKLRHEAAIVVESGEPREVMHFCLLLGYGANGINPYLAFECIDELRRRGDLPTSKEIGHLADNYIAAIKKGILKTMSKMGISTLRSYQGAQLFEAIGLDPSVIDLAFPGTVSRIGGVNLGALAEEVYRRHRAAHAEPMPGQLDLDYGGEYHYRYDGQNHLWNPESISALQHAVRNNDPAAYDRYARLINDQSRQACTLRGLFEFVPAAPVPLEEVEPAEEIVKRFVTGAMSHGSISKEAHETMCIAMNRLGGRSNTGEGGEDPRRYRVQPDGDDLNSGIKQVASARFGVTIEYLAQAKELQIKMAQGAKPGEGGQLPGHKVTEEIARLRHSTAGVTLISPPPHHDIYSIEDLAQLIYDLKCSNPGVKVSVKLVCEVGVGTVAAGVAKGNADEVLVSGHDGGTGASPLSSIKHTGGPWELGLAETQQTLVLNGLRDRIQVQVDGQIKTGRDVVIGALLGAERFGFGTAALVSLGCIMMRKCHEGTCPVGVATQDPALRKRFAGQPEHLMRYLTFVADEVRRLMAELGFRRFEDMIGRVDRLSSRQAVSHYKTRGLDFSKIFQAPDSSDGRAIRQVRTQTSPLADHLDWIILQQAERAITDGLPVRLGIAIRNVHRTVGTILSNRIVKAHGSDGLADGTIEVTLRGSAGQSFGAFLAPGVTLKLIGDSNDYLGKGLSGGRIVVQTPREAHYAANENIIVGNTLLYGATRGEVFINGMAGERFAVRNSGAVAVVEGVGDHGCEYMTGGTVVVLGQTGRNFAAGMSGGVAYVLDEHQLFDTLCNLDMVDLETVYHQSDQDLLHELIARHHQWTGSAQARRVLANWSEMVGKFVKVMPIDYRKALARLREREQRETEFTPATEEVFRG
ncbi:MAG: Ferredoxin-dependent glutamate synthase 1 [Planctomycetes bacterium ADurb.Bin126]|nr:MAG: Ferredoxin-dependent glutamate synthase 1 [Planctomycetes bacterium ADurb.Bin126]HOD80481.1 glutamate synthase large subunit [Phycisphaerae bacterium]HQL72093.1 glutamate synthase large subunit [Phycisphaerae bacterium]